MVYIVERLVLETIYVLNKQILQFFSLKSAVYNWEQFQIKSGLKWHMYDSEIFHFFNTLFHCQTYNKIIYDLLEDPKILTV